MSADPVDNGPEIDPLPPGPPATTPFEYLVVPFQRPVPADAPLTQGASAISQIETLLLASGATAERVDLVDGRRVYRVPIRYLLRFRRDAAGAYIQTWPKQIFRFVPDDPTVGMALANYWTGVG